MLDFFPFEKLRTYPHMKPRDVLIWERFIAAYPELYKKVQYDFHVGDVPQFSPAAGDITVDNQHMLYQLKIDVVGFKENEINIIEVKPSAAPSSIGQVISYEALYNRDASPSFPVSAVLVTDEERPNMRFLCEQKNVTLYVV